MKLSESLISYAAWWIDIPSNEFSFAARDHIRTIYPAYPNLPLVDLIKNGDNKNYGNDFRCYLCLFEAEIVKEEELKAEFAWMDKHHS